MRKPPVCDLIPPFPWFYLIWCPTILLTPFDTRLGYIYSGLLLLVMFAQVLWNYGIIIYCQWRIRQLERKIRDGE